MNDHPTPDELAAALVAIDRLLADEADAPPPDITDRAGWRNAARLLTAGLPPSRTPVPPSWATIERLRRGCQTSEQP